MRRYRSRLARATLALCIAAPESSLLPTLTGAENALSPDSQKWPAHQRLAEKAGLLPTLWAKTSGSQRRGKGSIERGGGESTLQALERRRRELPTLTASDEKRGFANVSPQRDGGPSLKEKIGKLLPTLTATRNGSTNNGSPRDGRSEYATKGTPSLDSLAGATLNPQWCCWFMGAPKNWTLPENEHLDLPLFRLLGT
jgi:hypothetical protein